MKHLGMSADVHMGLFDDSKYVNEVRAELAHETAPTPIHDSPAEPMSNTAAKAHYKTIADALFACTTIKQLQGAWARHYPITTQLPDGIQEELTRFKDELKDKLMGDPEASMRRTPAPNFDNLEPAHG
jgi:hypothetical protein